MEENKAVSQETQSKGPLIQCLYKENKNDQQNLWENISVIQRQQQTNFKSEMRNLIEAIYQGQSEADEFLTGVINRFGEDVKKKQKYDQEEEDLNL